MKPWQAALVYMALGFFSGCLFVGFSYLLDWLDDWRFYRKDGTAR